MVSWLNEDWLVFPQLRYCLARLLVGSIMVEGTIAITINTIEPYSRDQFIDAHYERQGLAVSSYPTTPEKYGLLRICLIPTADGLKLVIGSRTCSFLVTSSARLDTVSVNLGPETTHFVPTSNTRLFVDSLSLQACESLLKDQSVARVQSMLSMNLLKQVRSKFDKLSTYTMCRASSSIASLPELQPLSIWTLCSVESTNPKISQQKIVSSLFRIVASEVIKFGKKATLKKSDFDEIASEIQGAMKNPFDGINELFGNSDEIGIISNKVLNRYLTDLAGKISNKQDNEKRIQSIINSIYD